MPTDDLITALSEGLTPASPRTVPLRALAAGLAGGAAAFALLAVWLGFRPDLSQAVATPFFWVKALYAMALGAAGLWCVERLSRPTGSARSSLLLALAVVAVLALAGVWQLVGAPADTRLAVWLGGSWSRCPFYVLALSAPVLMLVLAVMRRFAPTQFALAGAAAGLFSGGVAATVYGLHCPESTAAFVATWYSLGIALSAALGAALGPIALRWR